MCWKIICLLVLLFNGMHSTTGVGGDDAEQHVSEDISTLVGGREGQAESISGVGGRRKALNSAAVGMAESPVEASETLPESLDADLDAEVDGKPSSESEEKDSASEVDSEVESSPITAESESAVSTESPDISFDSIPEPSLEDVEAGTFESTLEPAAESSEEADDSIPELSAEISEDAYDSIPEPSTEDSELAIESIESSGSQSSAAPSETGVDESSPSLASEEDMGGGADSSSLAEASAQSEAVTGDVTPGQQRSTPVEQKPREEVLVDEHEAEVQLSESPSSSNAGRTAGIVIGVLASVALVVAAAYGGYRVWQRTRMNYNRGWRPADMELEGIHN